MSRIDVAVGSVIGRDHARLGRSNQDAYAVRRDGPRLVAVVADGCGSARRSELGAAFGVAALATAVMAKLRDGDALDAAFAEAATTTLTLALATMAERMLLDADELPAITAEHFLFSFLCLADDGARALVFGVGDGVVVVDDAVTILDAGPENAPPYVGYRLATGALTGGDAARSTAPRIHYQGAPPRRVLLATDGLAAWDANAGSALRSGGVQPSVRELARDASLFAVPTRLGKKLSVVGQVHGRLHDDTTVIVTHRSD